MPDRVRNSVAQENKEKLGKNAKRIATGHKLYGRSVSNWVKKNWKLIDHDTKHPPHPGEITFVKLRDWTELFVADRVVKIDFLDYPSPDAKDIWTLSDVMLEIILERREKLKRNPIARLIDKLKGAIQ